ncbi:hybrid sensor histidine kinase/response regulator transcription factor [Flavobacterium sp. ARAG 55.4]|uniref:hybrid sensor histidine kinase/response regulator transcription factor n=1 Tax=Flavobacterium sp. ARAG 55.4 TaxID=3451357 RepID=UPI003F46A4A1
MIKKGVVFFFWLLFAFQLSFSQEIALRFNRLSVDDGLAHSDVTSIIQDNGGFIWFGTLGGLNRFDGYEIKTFINRNSPFESVYKNRIVKIVPQNNLLWLVTQGGIECFDIKKEKFLNLKWKLNDNSTLSNVKINSIYISNAGKAYVLSNNYLKVFSIDFSSGNQIILTEIFLNNTPKNTIFLDMKSDKNGLEWIITSRGLFFVENISGKIKLRKIVVSNGDTIYSVFTGLYTKENNYLLLGTENGFLKANTSIFDTKKQQTVSASFYKINYPKISLQDGIDNGFFVNTFEKGLDNNYWIGSTLGLIKATLVGTAYKYNFFNENNSNLSFSSVIGLLKDKSGCLWISNYDGGVSYVDLNQKRFNSLKHELKSSTTISENYVRAILEDSSGNVWLGTEKTGLNYYNFETKSIKTFTHSENNKGSISSNKIRSLALDNKERLWVGTVDGLNIFSKESNSFFRISDNGIGDKFLSNKIIFSIAKDKFGNIWAGSWQNGLNRIKYSDSKNYSIEKIFKKQGSHYGLSSNVITFIYADDFYPEVFVGTDNGLNHIFLNEDGTIRKILHYLGSKTTVNTISSNWVWPIIRENDSTLWIGTLGGGLNRITLNNKLKLGYKAQTFSVNQGAPSTDIETILYDKKNNDLWLGGKGLSKFDITKKQFTNFDKDDGLVGNSFKVGSAYQGKSGRFYFGSTEGVNFFIPSNIKVNNYNSRVVLTNLYVNNKIVTIGELNEKNEILLNQSINSIDEIRLNHLENNFQLQFSSLHYGNPNRNHFKYRLLDYNKKWIDADANDRKASYSNLPYGDYVFEVMGTNNDGVWSKEIKRLKITVLAPWWFTNFAIFLYVLIFICGLFFSYYLIIRWFKLKNDYEVSKIHEQEKEKLFQLTTQFFTNISHEFKTPLTLILNPLEKLLNKDKINEYKKEKYYQLMYKNAIRLLRLINELVDYRKINSNSYKLNAKLNEIVPFLNEIEEAFIATTENKSIELIFENKLPIKKFQFDKAVLEKIIFNILGNSLKFTPNKGKISIKLALEKEKANSNLTNYCEIKSDYEAPSYVYLSIEDSGKGISEQALEHIFDRFFQADNDSEIQGSGIGLTLVRSLATIHHINIYVYSKENVGTQFILELPYINYEEVFQSDDAKNSVMLSKSALSPFDDKQNVITDSKVNLYENFTKPEILLVEDNLELRSFMKDHFEEEFKIIEANNGIEALELLEKHKIQIIISDIMMPLMDGVNFCKEVKNNVQFRGIPFILLSAKFNVESQIEGAQSGADVYIAKPFSMEVLHLTVLNMLRTRKQLKETTIENTFEEARKSVKGDIEDEFLKEVINCIDNNIEDVDFDVVKLCSLLGISKTKLYAKIKEVTSESIGGLIREIRLKKAAQLLSSTDMNIVQVMDKVGIQSQSHFTKSFKKQFGVTPSEFVKNLNIKK